MKNFIQKHKIKILDIIISASLLGIIFLVPVYFSFLEINFSIFQLPKIIIFRILLSIGMLAYIARVLLQSKIKYKVNNFVLLFIISAIIILGLSSLFSIHPHVSYWGSYTRGQGFFTLASYLLFFLLAILNIKNSKDIKQIISVIIAGSFFACLYGLVQFFDIDFLKWKEPFSQTGRLFSTLGQPNFLAHYLIIIIPLTIYSIFYVYKNFVLRLFISSLIFLQFFCLIFTASRSAWPGLLAGALFFLFIFTLNKSKKAGILIILLITIIIASFYALSTQGYLDNFDKTSPIARARDVFDKKENPQNIRMKYLKASWTEIKTSSLDRKLFGYGADTLSSVFIKHYKPSWAIRERLNLWPDRAHNLFFDHILQFGFLSLLIFSLFYIGLTKEILKFLRKAEKNKNYWLLVSATTSLIGFFVYSQLSFSTTTHYIYLYLLLVIILYTLNLKTEEKIINIKINKNIKIIIFALSFLFLATFVYYYNINRLKADVYILSSKKYSNNGDCFNSLFFSQKAIGLDFSENFYKKTYIDVGAGCIGSLFSVENADSLKTSIIAYNDSIPEKERNYFYDLAYAHAESMFATTLYKERIDKAEKEFEELIKNYPNISTGYLNFANLEMKIGKYNEAINILNRGLLLLPDLDNPNFITKHKKRAEAEYIYFYDLLAGAYIQEGDTKNGIYFLEKIIEIDETNKKAFEKLEEMYKKINNLNK